MSLLFLFASLFLDGLSIQLGWSNFICPLGVSTINYWQALGIVVMVSLTTYQARRTSLSKQELTSVAVKNLTQSLTCLGLILLLGLGAP